MNEPDFDRVSEALGTIRSASRSQFLSSFHLLCFIRDTARDALDNIGEIHRKYYLGQRLTKKSGSKWTGRVVGFYSTELTPVGYCIESETERGSVQIYPEAALEPA